MNETGSIPLVLCSGSLGGAPLEVKWRATAAAGFRWVSVYGDEYLSAIDSGVDASALLDELGLAVAEVDGVATTMAAPDRFEAALDIARALSARSITIVETEQYNPGDADQVRAACEAFGRYCDIASDHGVLVHIEPFAWSALNATSDVAQIVGGADRQNGGVMLDLWHHERGPDAGVLAPELPLDRLFGIQLADTVAHPWPAVRDECMNQRLLPGDGHADLARQLRELAAAGPLPPLGVEVFGETLSSLDPVEAAQRCHAAALATVRDAEAEPETPD